MSKSLSIGVVIGATLDGGFASTVGGAQKQFNQLGAAIKGADADAKRLEAFRTLKVEVAGSEKVWQAATVRTSELAREIPRVGAAAKEAKAAFSRAKTSTDAAKVAYEQKRETLKRLTIEMRQTKAPTEEMRAAHAKAKAESSAAGVSYRQQRERLGQLKGEAKTSAATLKELNTEFADAKKVGEKAKKTFEDQRRKLHELRAEMAKAGQSTRDLAGQERRLGEAVDTLRRKYDALGSAMRMRQANLDRRSALRGQLVDAVALGAALRAPIVAAMDLESAEVRLGTVLNTDDLERDLGAARKQALAFSRDNMASATEVLDIQYALNSAGLDASTARLGSELVSKVATITGGAAEGVGEVVATVFNNLGGSLEGEASEKLERIGELLTKTQFKFQIRDFGQLGESMKMAAPALSMFNVELDQGLTLIGALNSAGMQGSQAGTSLSATFRQLSKASDEFGFDLVRNKDGQLDFIATLESLSDTIGGFDNLDQETIDRLQKSFGDEGMRGVMLLGKQLGTLREAQRDVAEGSKGLVDSSYERFAKSSAGQMKIFRNRIGEVGVAVGSVLLPGLNMVVGAAGSLAVGVAWLSEKFPFLTTVVVGLTAALIVGKVAAIGLGYGWTFVKGAWLSAVVAGKAVSAALALANLRTITLGATTKATAVSTWALAAAQKGWAIGSTIVTAATGLVTTGFRVMGAAVMSNPIGLAIAAIAASAFLVIKYWEPIKGFFGGLWEGIKEIFSAGVGFLTKVWEVSPLGLLFKAGEKLAGFVGGAIGGLFGGEKKDDAAATQQPEAHSKRRGLARTAGAAALGATLAISPSVATEPPATAVPGAAIHRSAVAPSVAPRAQGKTTPTAAAMPDVQPMPQWMAARQAETPAARAADKGGERVVINSPFHGDIVIQGTGMDAKAIAAEVERVLRERESRAQARARGRMYD